MRLRCELEPRGSAPAVVADFSASASADNSLGWIFHEELADPPRLLASYCTMYGINVLQSFAFVLDSSVWLCNLSLCELDPSSLRRR